MPIGKYKGDIGCSATRKDMDAVNNLVGHWQWRPVISVNNTAGA
jgi:hypothetical protein